MLEKDLYNFAHHNVAPDTIHQLNGDGTAKAQLHYQQVDIQPIEIMQKYLTAEEFRGFLKGNLIKYSLRANFKGNEPADIGKAFQYAKWLGQALRRETIDPRE